MCEITESESLERRLDSLAAENEQLRAEAITLKAENIMAVGRAQRLVIERDRLRERAERAERVLGNVEWEGLVFNDEGAMFSACPLCRGRLSRGHDEPCELSRVVRGPDAAPACKKGTLIVSPEQYELGYAVPCSFPIQGGTPIRREPYRLIRRLPDGNYLIEDPSADGPAGEE